MNVAVARKHAAPRPYLGFALQLVRLCFHLLTCPAGAKVSLEHLDDVAIHHPDENVTLEQTKSALKQNPLTDWSDELWKAIANWLDAIASGRLAPGDSRFQLYVTPPRQGDWAQALSDATTEADVEALLAVIKAKHAKLRKPKGCESNLQRFLNASAENRNAVIMRFRLLADEADPVDALRDLIKTTVAPELVDELCHSAIGMAKEQADRLIRKGQPALVDGDAFKANFRAFVRKTNIPGLLSSFTPAPSITEASAVLSARPIFIRQLEIIEAADRDRVRAVSDFLRASADKSATQGIPHEVGQGGRPCVTGPNRRHCVAPSTPGNHPKRAWSRTSIPCMPSGRRHRIRRDRTTKDIGVPGRRRYRPRGPARGLILGMDARITTHQPATKFCSSSAYHICARPKSCPCRQGLKWL